MGRVKLLEVFKDFKVRVVSRRPNGTEYVGEVVPLAPRPTGGGITYEELARLRAKGEILYRKVSPEEIDAYVFRLQQRYPDRGYRVVPVTVKEWGFCLRTRRKSKVMFRPVRCLRGRRRFLVIRKRPGHPKDVPLYYEVKTGTWFVPSSYLRRARRLAMFIIMVTLGALGVSQTRWWRR